MHKAAVFCSSLRAPLPCFRATRTMLLALLLAPAVAAQDMTTTAKASTAATSTAAAPTTTAPDPGWVKTNGPGAGDIASIVLGVVCGIQFFGLVSAPAD